MYFSSKAMVFVSSTVQNWTELFMIIPHLLGPSPFEVIMVIFTISQHIPHLKRIIWNDHLNIKFEQWTSFGKNLVTALFKNIIPGTWVHRPFMAPVRCSALAGKYSVAEREWQEGGTETRDASTIPVMVCGCHLRLSCTCTEDTLQWRH